MPTNPSLSTHRLIDRRLLLLALASLPTAAVAAPCPPPRVLFVCPAGTVKSPIARELLKARARELGVALDVRSRGVAVEDHVSEALAARLRADRIELASQPAMTLTAGDISQADIVVAFDAAAGDPRLVGARAWRTPSWNDDYAAAKADMATRIGALASELAARAATCR